LARTALQHRARAATNEPPPPTFGVGLLDDFELTAHGRLVSVPLSAQRVLAFLALADRPMLRVRVAGTLWPEAAAPRAGANLRSALWRLPDHGIVEATPSHVRMRPGVAVDFRDAVTLARRAIDGSIGLDGGSVEATLSRDLLPDWDEEWLSVERERFRHLRLHALERLCGRLIDQGRFGRAVEIGQLAVAGDPLRETAHGVLIRAHLAEGNRGAAIRQYRVYAGLLREELDAEPAPSITGLVSPPRP
jgi:DNA-binding SARP family transcriptional activator